MKYPMWTLVSTQADKQALSTWPCRRKEKYPAYKTEKKIFQINHAISEL